MEIEGKSKMTPWIIMIIKVPKEFRCESTPFKFLMTKMATESFKPEIKKLEFDIAGGGVQL